MSVSCPSLSCPSLVCLVSVSCPSPVRLLSVSCQCLVRLLSASVPSRPAEPSTQASNPNPSSTCASPSPSSHLRMLLRLSGRLSRCVSPIISRSRLRRSPSVSGSFSVVLRFSASLSVVSVGLRVDLSFGLRFSASFSVFLRVSVSFSGCSSPLLRFALRFWVCVPHVTLTFSLRPNRNLSPQPETLALT